MVRSYDCNSYDCCFSLRLRFSLRFLRGFKGVSLLLRVLFAAFASIAARQECIALDGNGNSFSEFRVMYQC